MSTLFHSPIQIIIKHKMLFLDFAISRKKKMTATMQHLRISMQNYIISVMKKKIGKQNSKIQTD